jgi:neutral ceramidase
MKGWKAMKVGYASIDITPPIGVELCGYGYFLGRRAERVMDPLYARAVSMQQGEKTVLLINCDLIGLTQELTGDIKEQLSKKLGLAKKSIMVSCTHTHTGPATGVLIGCGEVDDSYMDSLPDLIIQAGVHAYENMRGIKGLKYINKLPIEPIGFNRVDKTGSVDNNVSGLLFEFNEGNPLAIVHYACHPVTLGPSKDISADYPGRVVKALSDQGYDGLFVNGFCGDVDPVSNLERWGSGTGQTIDEYGRRIANAFLNGIDNATWLNSEDFNESTIEAYEYTIDLKLQPFDEAKIDEENNIYKDQANGQVAGIWADKMKKYLKTAENPYIESVTVQILRVANILLVGLPGETFTELGMIISKSLPDYHVITMGNCNFTMRYIATKEDIINRGYAGHTSCFIYGRLPLIPGEGERLAHSVSKHNNFSQVKS